MLVAIALAWPATQAVAQTAATPEGGSQAGKLDVVTVAAERRAENSKDVPISVSTLSGETLDIINSSGADLRMLSGRVPSLNVESSFGRAFPRFYLRGYGNTDFRLNASQPVSLIYDDVVQENPILKGFPAFDLERIEVLAGPQGSLFGRNTPAGVVKFDSVKPSKKTDGYFNVSAGTFGTVNAEGAFNLPLTGDWNARVSAQVQHRDNWVSNDKGPTKNMEGYDDRAIRVQAAYDPAGGDFSALFNVHNRDLKGSARVFRANVIKPGTNELVDNFDPAKVQFDGVNGQTLTNTGGSMRLKWSLRDVNVYSITGYETVKAYSRGDVDGGYGAVFAGTMGPGFIPFPSETADGIRDHSQVTQEFRVESKTSGPLSWQAGLYYFDEQYVMDAFAFDSLGGGAQTGWSATKQTNTSWAGFGSIRYDLSKDFNIRAGVRYTQDKKQLSTQALQSTVDTSNGVASSADDAKTNWDLSATYKLSPTTNLFGRLATGYRGSSIQPASAFGALTQAGPETITSAEVGIKADLWDRSARTAVSLFNYSVKGQQITAVGGATNSTILLSAQESLGQGVEWNFDAFLTERFRVGVAASYNFTKFNDPSLVVAGGGSGPTITDRLAYTKPNFFGGVDKFYYIDGNPLPNAPQWIASVNARYGIPAGNGAEYFVYTDWSYRSSTNIFLYTAKEFTAKPLLEGGLRVGYNWGDGKYELAAFGRNITNAMQVTGAIDFNNLTGFVNEPRTFGVQFKAAF
ncbi:MAG: TonB-dependent receptor [Burkholderiales bacterium]|nr:TonB-dependent receptor [Burkholderiales bacterium]